MPTSQTRVRQKWIKENNEKLYGIRIRKRMVTEGRRNEKKKVLDLMFWNEAIYLIVTIFLLSPLDFEVFDIYTGPEGVLTTYNLTEVPVIKSTW